MSGWLGPRSVGWVRLNKGPGVFPRPCFFLLSMYFYTRHHNAMTIISKNQPMFIFIHKIRFT